MNTKTARMTLLLGLLAGTTAWAAAAAPTPVPKTRKNDLTPLPAAGNPPVTHAPFESGECDLCHKSADPKAPGPITKPVNDLCFDCHDDMRQVLARKSVHVAAQKSCVNCHNPHNAKRKFLLVEKVPGLCMSCHEAIRTIATQSAVKHDALTTGASCLNCHNPHGASVEHLLIQLPFNLCLSCHGKDGVLDHDGKKLTNMKKLLDENPQWHGPVAAQDCTVCHNPHGYKNFRLLNHKYPRTFYSAYDPKLYALCFECHDPDIVAEPVTTTLTGFRDGNRNLHYLHVNKPVRGRTCRACHEVHASKQDHQIRDGVPYGSTGWILKLHYTKTATGGSCAKTCHGKKTYNNRDTGLAKNGPGAAKKN
ncbi:MAG: cytochrome C [Kiritimatiellaeota bacterium]|nr:cytochrome C [Kiritimatiellota bacterium]